MSRSRVQPQLLASSLLLFLALSAAEGRASDRHFTETFDTNLYKGSLTTAAWDTVAGELRLEPFSIAGVGAYDTPGIALDVAVSGNHAYVADGANGVQVVDVSLVSFPMLAGSYTTPSAANAIAVAGDRAFVAAHASGLLILDITDPSSPSLLGNYDTVGFAYDVAVSGNYAYVANNNQPASVIDISDPTTPSQVATLPISNFAQGISVAGVLAYVADGYAGLKIFDITDPTTPSLVGTYNTSGFAQNVVVDGTMAYVADFSAGLQVIDITNPALPVLLGSYATPEDVRGVSVVGDYLYLVSNGSVRVIDIRDPANPALIAAWASPGTANSLAVSGEHAFVADGATGLQVIDVADILVPPALSYLYPVGVTCTPAVSGDYMFVGRRKLLSIPPEYELYTYDISDPSQPFFRRKSAVTGGLRDFAVDGNRLYSASGDRGLVALNITNPISPFGVGVYDPGGYVEEVAVAGHRVFATSFDRTLHAIDATTFGLLGTYTLPAGAIDLVIEGNYAYLPCGLSGLQVVDIRDPSLMAFAGQYVPAGWTVGVAIQGNYAYTAGDYGLHIVDVTDPSTPTFVASYPLTNGAAAVAVTGDIAFLWEEAGLHVLNVGNPLFPYLMGTHTSPLPSASQGLLFGDHLLIGESLFGFKIYRVADRYFDNTNNVGASVFVNQPTHAIHRVRVASDQDETVSWELTNHFFSDFQQAPTDGSWVELLSEGPYLLWRATLVASSPGINPTVRDVSLDWLFHHAVIDSIKDVPNDQGGAARLHFTRSGHDFADESTYPAATYDIYRRVDDPVLKKRVAQPRPSRRQKRPLWSPSNVAFPS